ncbi:MAG: hypothetical protein VZQ97_03885, partial [Candidatus Onthomonas sp.]|nr:hypothetical protein [Candidatus Onthomonas sp.]
MGDGRPPGAGFRSRLRTGQADHARADQQNQNGGNQAEARAGAPIAALFLLLAGFLTNPVHHAALQALRGGDGKLGGLFL